jgi:hypothetical protein
MNAAKLYGPFRDAAAALEDVERRSWPRVPGEPTLCVLVCRMFQTGKQYCWEPWALISRESVSIGANVQVGAPFVVSGKATSLGDF